MYLPLCSRKNKSHVKVSFDWFENQGRHTVHMRLLVWLENLSIMKLGRIQTKIPDDDDLI